MHQPSGAMQGQAADIAIQAEQIIYLKRMMAERIAFHTGQPIERDRGRLGPRPLVHRRGGTRVRVHRRGHRPVDGPGRRELSVTLEARPRAAAGPDAERAGPGVNDAPDGRGLGRRSTRGRGHAVVSRTSAGGRSPRSGAAASCCNLVRTEIKVKYKNSFLGLVWSMLVAGHGARRLRRRLRHHPEERHPELRHLPVRGPARSGTCSRPAVLTATGVIVNNAGLVKKVSFPREILALAVGRFGRRLLLLPGLRDGHPPGGRCTGARPWRVCGCSRWRSCRSWSSPRRWPIFLAAVNVYLRDTQHLVEVLVGAAWFWACPIVYSYQTQRRRRSLAGHGISTWLYLAEPADPDRDDLPAGHLRAPARSRPRPLARPHADPVPAELGLLDLRRARLRSSSAASLLFLTWRWSCSAGSTATSPRSSERWAPSPSTSRTSPSGSASTTRSTPR